MPSVSEVDAELKLHNLKLAGDVVQDLNNGSRFFVFLEVNREEDGRQVPSSRYLNVISEDLERRGIEVTFILSEGGDDDDIQGSLKTMLFKNFPDIIRNAFLTYEKDEVVIWIEPKGILSVLMQQSMEEKVAEFLSLLKIPLASINFTNSEDISMATPTAILRAIKIKSPADLENIAKYLIEKGLNVPNNQWLNRILDRLRKSKKIIRQKNGNYILTLEGLGGLGTAKNSKSSDVTRALDVARRRD